MKFVKKMEKFLFMGYMKIINFYNNKSHRIIVMSPNEAWPIRYRYNK